jgi:hypothetical protein
MWYTLAYKDHKAFARWTCIVIGAPAAIYIFGKYNSFPVVVNFNKAMWAFHSAVSLYLTVRDSYKKV